ncbi:hypothetical protein MASR2M39_11410 [Ignavibacteriales bacterium]
MSVREKYEEPNGWEKTVDAEMRVQTIANIKLRILYPNKWEILRSKIRNLKERNKEP